MTVDREQVRRQAQEVVSHGSFVHEDLPAEVAQHCLALLAELEQAERHLEKALSEADAAEDDWRREKALREQVKRGAEALIRIHESGEHRGEWPSDLPLTLARYCIALLAELEQAERERERYAEAIDAYRDERDWLEKRLTAAEAQLAKVPALVDGAQALVAALDSCPTCHGSHVSDWFRDALAVFEQEQKP